MIPSYSTASTLLANQNPLNPSALRGSGMAHPVSQLGSSLRFASGAGSFATALGQHLPFYTHLGSNPEDISVEYLKSGLTQLHEAIQAWARLAVRPRVMQEDLAFHLLTTHLDMLFSTLSGLDAHQFERALKPTAEAQHAWDGVWNLLPTVTNRWNSVRSLFDTPPGQEVGGLEGSDSAPSTAATVTQDTTIDGGAVLVKLVSEAHELSTTAAYSECFSGISLPRRWIWVTMTSRPGVTAACVAVAVALAVITVVALWMAPTSAAWSSVGTATSIVLTLLTFLFVRDAHEASRRAREFFGLLRVPQQRRAHIPLESWSDEASIVVPMSGILQTSSASMAQAPSPATGRTPPELPPVLGPPSGVANVLQREFVAIVVDNDGLIQYWSPGAEAATGFGRHAVERHKYLHEVLHQRSYKMLYSDRNDLQQRMDSLMGSSTSKPPAPFRHTQLQVVLISSSKDRRPVLECTWRQLQPGGDRYLCGYVVGSAFPRAAQYFASMFAAMLDELCLPEAHDPPLMLPEAATVALRNISSMMQATGYSVERSLASWDEASMAQISLECTRVLGGDSRSTVATATTHIRNADAGTVYLDLVMLRRALATVVSELRESCSAVSVGLHPVEGIECLPNAQHLLVIFHCCPPGYEEAGALDSSAAQSVIQKLEQKNLGVGVLRWTAKELHVAAPASRSRFVQHPAWNSDSAESNGASRVAKQKQNHPSFVMPIAPAREREIEDRFLIAVVDVDPIAFRQLETALLDAMPYTHLLPCDTVRDFVDKLDSHECNIEAAIFAADQFSALKEFIEPRCSKRGVVLVRLDPSSHPQQHQVFESYDNQLRLTLPIRYEALQDIAEAVRTQRETNWNKMQQEEIVMDEIIGKGATSTVYKAHGKVTGSIVAVKHYRQTEGRNEGNIECAMYQRLREFGGHPNILQFITLKQNNGTQLVLQYCPGSLQKELQTNKPPLELAAITNLFRQCLEAVAFLHDHDVVHRDIKPDNFLLDGDVVRMNDFGSALQVVDGEMSWISPEVLGTGFSPLYAPPEATVATVPTKGLLMARDIWACGMLLLSMLKAVPKELNNAATRRAFFRDKKMAAYLSSCKFHFSENGVAREESGKPLLLSLLKQMLEIEPLRRPTARQLLDHEWFRQTRTRREMFSSASSSGGMPIASLSDGQRASNPAAAYFNSVARRSGNDASSTSATHFTKDGLAARDSASSTGDIVAQPLEFPPDLGPR